MPTLKDVIGLDKAELDALNRSVSTEANRWKDASNAVLSLKNRIAGADDERMDMALRSLFNVCAEGLQGIQIAGGFPEKTVREREDYRDALLKTVRAREQQTYDSALDVNVHIGPLATSVLDYAEGPLGVYFASRDILSYGASAFDKVRKTSVFGSVSYKVSVESSREQRRRTLMQTRSKMPKGKIIGRGEKIDNFSTMQLENGLLEFYQPVMQGVGMDEAAAERMSGSVRKRLGSLADARHKVRKSERLPRVLIENAAVLDDLVAEIRPRSFYDMGVGHPLQHRLSEYVLSNEGLKNRLEALEAIRMQVFPGVQCPQYFLYDQLGDLVWGDPRSALWTTSAYLEGWGYGPLPGFENVTAYSVVQPKGLDIAKVLPGLEKYAKPESMTPVV